MPERTQTHRLVKKPQITARFLADYMAASERKRRTIIRGCKFQTLARVMQHDAAKLAISKSLWDGKGNDFLAAESCRIRNRLTDSDFDRDTNDANADYIERFIKMRDNLALPKADYAIPSKSPATTINGTKINVELRARLSPKAKEKA